MLSSDGLGNKLQLLAAWHPESLRALEKVVDRMLLRLSASSSRMLLLLGATAMGTLNMAACRGREVQYEARHDTPEQAVPVEKQVFAAIVADEDDATKAADRLYPEPAPNASPTAYAEWSAKHQAHYHELRRASRQRIAARFHLTEEDLSRISSQGIRERWPPLDTR